MKLTISMKWIICSVLAGIIVGLAASLFYYSMNTVTGLRLNHPWLLYLLPFSGLFIVWMYHLMHLYKDTGTNNVISAIHSEEKLPLQLAPLIFFGTSITHLFGGSAGREGAALQLGGSIGNYLGQLFRFDKKDQKVMIMCGMSAAFSALFGTPMAAAFFSMEVVSVGVIYYVALLPCVISALIAHFIAIYFGFHPELFLLAAIPDFGLRPAVTIIILALLCVLVSAVFCKILHLTSHGFQKIFANPYLRVFIGGCLVVLMTLLVGSRDYNGTGITIIEKALANQVVPGAFLLKMIFTAVTLGSGFKGGEVVPSLFVGSTFGCLCGQFLGFSPALCAAVGMTSVFCGVTNCPIASLLISFELFGYDGMPYFLLAIAFSYMFSGYCGLYDSQKIMYSKYHTRYINKKAH
ncbi:MAG: chloride channel protein [Lachnospiraceae bacterium]|nr:chloride channel protein [Lachnospiraceae bacterium]